MKTFLYKGGPAINGVTFRDGRQIMLHKGKCYELDETDPYTKTMLAKRNENGMPAPWLQEVEPEPLPKSEPAPEEEQDDTSETFTTTKKGRR